MIGRSGTTGASALGAPGPSTFALVDDTLQYSDSDDWLIEDEYPSSDEVNDAPPQGPQVPSTSTSQVPPLVNANKKRKSRDDDKGTGSHFVQTPDPKGYRQPTCQVLPHVRQHPVWKDGFKKLEKVLNTLPRRSAATLQHAGSSHRRITAMDATWGVVEVKQLDQTAGPCKTCQDSDVECIVQVRKSDGVTMSSPSLQVVSICIHCLVNRKRCDLKGEPQGRSRRRKASTLTSLPNKSESSTSVKTTERSTLDRTLKLPPVSVAKHRPKSVTTTTAPKDASTVPHDSDLPHGGAARSKSIAPGVRDALRDVEEFKTYMWDALKERNQLDLQTRGSFTIVGEQIAVLKQFLDET